jgi:hypothetical protein
MKLTSVLLAISLLLPFSAAAQARSDSARAHVTQHGTFVRRHKHDIYPTKGNVNPHTGKRGTR